MMHTNRSTTQINTAGIKWFLAVLGTGVLTVAIFNALIVNIDRGNVGVVFSKTQGGVQAESLHEGWNFKVPFVETVTEYPIAQVNYTMSKISEEGKVKGDDSVEFTTSDNQNGKINVTVSFGVNAPMATAVYDNFRGHTIDQIETEYIRLKAKAAVQTCTTAYTILDIHGGKKAEAAGCTTRELQKLIDSDAQGLKDQYANRVKNGGHVPIKPDSLERLFTVYSVTFGEDYLPTTVQDYINSKLKAETDRANAETKLKQIEVDAQQKVAQAKADLDAARLQAESTKVKADADAYANQVVAKSLTPELVQLKAIEKLSDKVQILDVQSSGLANVYGLRTK